MRAAAMLIGLVSTGTLIFLRHQDFWSLLCGDWRACPDRDRQFRMWNGCRKPDF